MVHTDMYEKNVYFQTQKWLLKNWHLTKKNKKLKRWASIIGHPHIRYE